MCHSFHDTLEIEYIYCCGGMSNGYDAGLSGLNLGSGGFKTFDMMSREGSVIQMTELSSSNMKEIYITGHALGDGVI